MGGMVQPSASHLITQSLATAERLARKSKRLARRIEHVDARVRCLQNARLLSGFVFFAALVFAAVKPGWMIPGPAAAIFAPVFAVLVARTRRWRTFGAKLKRLQAFTARQEARARGQSPTLPSLPFQHESHGSDLDYFGHFSLWTLLDETLTDEGSHTLKTWIVQPPLTRDEIVARQATVQALRGETWFYTRLSLIADRDELRASSKQILDFLARAAIPRWVAPTYAGVLLVWIAWILSLTSLSSHFGDAAGAVTLGLFVAFITLNGAIVLNLGPIFHQGVGVSHHLSLLAPVFSALEARIKRSRILRELAPATAVSGPAKEARGLNFAVGMLSTVANPIFHLLVNALSPWTATGALLLERQRRRLDASFATSLRELAQLEALLSLAIFDRYQTRTYPSLDAERLRARQIFHPLVSRQKVVANDLEFAPGKTLGLLTGSNMSGKSTFLRTIGLNQTLANIGAPVLAEEFATRPLAIETCIEVSDSLRDGFSYFYAEVRRLKALLDSAQNHQVLFLIDEIFRGTNNRERQIGSRAVIRTLAQTRASQGFISTHDLELTALEKTEPAVVNLHFREHVTDGRMAFTYVLQTGASPTTNALRIMQIEGLPVDANTDQS